MHPHSPLQRNALGQAPGADLSGQQVGGIAERIASTISIGMLTVGERLPAEVELATQFGVAVATLRKALATLRAQGIVETRRGRNGGTFVVKAPYPSEEALRASLANTSIASLRDLSDELAAVSSATAKLAASRVLPGRRTRLAELAFFAREAKNAQDRSRADSRFHIEIAVLSHSQRLLTAQQRLQAEVTPLLWCEALHPMSPQEAFNDHLGLIVAVEQGHAEEAAMLAEQHATRSLRHIVDAKLLLPESLQSAEGNDPTSVLRRQG